MNKVEKLPWPVQDTDIKTWKTSVAAVNKIFLEVQKEVDIEIAVASSTADFAPETAGWSALQKHNL